MSQTKTTRTKCWPWDHEWAYNDYYFFGELRRLKQCRVCGKVKHL